MSVRHSSAQEATLSPRAQSIVSTISDESLRLNVEQTLLLATDSLFALKRIHLPQDLIEEGGAKSEDTLHLDLVPYVLSALTSINSLLEHLVDTYPIPEDTNEAVETADDFDLEFDLVDGPSDTAAGVQHVESPQSYPVSEKSPIEHVIDTTYALGSMLRQRVGSFAPRLRHALAQNDSWSLLAEIDYYQHALIKAVQGLFFGILTVFEATVNREEILPDYRSAVREAVELRQALTDLAYHVGRFNQALAATASSEHLPLVVAIADRLARFSSRPEYRSLRTEDKRVIVEFRRSLYEMRYRPEATSMGRVRQAIEGFSKFLEAMQAINHREVLVLHDSNTLSEVLAAIHEALNLAMLDAPSAMERLFAIVKKLTLVQGRHPDLDDALRAFRPKQVTMDNVETTLTRWRELALVTQSVVG